MLAPLTEREILTLCMELDHAPSCVWSEGAVVAFQDEGGALWDDDAFSIPHVSPPCTCGYFDGMRSGREKLLAMLAGMRAARSV